MVGRQQNELGKFMWLNKSPESCITESGKPIGKQFRIHVVWTCEDKVITIGSHLHTPFTTSDVYTKLWQHEELTV